MDRTKRIMVKALNADSVSLYSDERPIDYGHCGEIMKDKYGEERGAKMYEDMINMPGNASARFFVVASQIQREKKAMLTILRSRGTEFNYVSHISDVSYETLYDAWKAVA